MSSPNEAEPAKKKEKILYVVTSCYAGYKTVVDTGSIKTWVFSNREKAVKHMRKTAKKYYKEDDIIQEESTKFIEYGENAVWYGENENDTGSYRTAWGFMKIEEVVKNKT